MRNKLSAREPHKRESAIINLDDKDVLGTNWVAFKKKGDKILIDSKTMIHVSLAICVLNFYVNS